MRANSVPASQSLSRRISHAAAQLFSYLALQPFSPMNHVTKQLTALSVVFKSRGFGMRHGTLIELFTSFLYMLNCYIYVCVCLCVHVCVYIDCCWIYVIVIVMFVIIIWFNAPAAARCSIVCNRLLLLLPAAARYCISMATSLSASSGRSHVASMTCNNNNYHNYWLL